MEEGSSPDLINVLLAKERLLSEITAATLWGERQGGALSGEAETMSGFGERFGTNDDHV